MPTFSFSPDYPSLNKMSKSHFDAMILSIVPESGSKLHNITEIDTETNALLAVFGEKITTKSIKFPNNEISVNSQFVATINPINLIATIMSSRDQGTLIDRQVPVNEPSGSINDDDGNVRLTDTILTSVLGNNQHGEFRFHRASTKKPTMKIVINWTGGELTCSGEFLFAEPKPNPANVQIPANRFAIFITNSNGYFYPMTGV